MLSSSLFFFFSSRRRHTRWPRYRSSDVCSSALHDIAHRIEKAGILAERHAHPLLSNLLGRQLIIPGHTAIDVPTGLHKRMSGPVTVGAGVNHARHACVLILEHFVAENFTHGGTQIGRASCRERVEITAEDGRIKRKKLN